MQERLFQFENPLEKRIGDDFFVNLPKCPGIYLMFGPGESLLYVGKAKNLKARLASYRRAKPERSPRKVMRLLNLVQRIEWEECETEEAALLRENALLRTKKPPFNTVNTRPENYYFIVFSAGSNCFRFRLTTNPLGLAEQGDGHSRDKIAAFGAFKGRRSVREAYSSLLRLLWVSLIYKNNERFELPMHLTRINGPNHFEFQLPLDMNSKEKVKWRTLIHRYFNGTSKRLVGHFVEKLLERTELHPFYYHLIQQDLDRMKEFYEWGASRHRKLRRLSPESDRIIPQDQVDDLIVRYRLTRRDNSSNT